MKNKLLDLNNHLFEALERLNDEEMTSDQLEVELKRSKAIAGIANSIISNASLALDVQKHMDEYAYKERNNKMPEMLVMKKEDLHEA